MKVGQAYSWSNEFNPEAVTFVVVAEATHRNSGADSDGSAGFLALILDGMHRSSSWEALKRPGETFTFAGSSAIARDSRPAL